MKETQSAYDKDDTRYTTPDKTTYAYDAVGRLATMSAPPSAGQSVRNDTTYSYYDNGWTKTSSDPWDIVTSYDYNELGAQTARTLTSAGGSSNRTMSWSYFPDGKLKARSDDGVPVGKQVVLVDNSDFNNTTATGTWPTASTATNKYGTDYATHAAGTGANVFTWQLNVPQSGTYQVYARFPTVSGAAVDAKYTVTSSAGPAVKTVNQTAGAGTWVSLGSFSFAEGNAQKVTLSDQATGTVVADAVKLVRDNSADVDNEKHDYSYRYDTNGNLTTITDASPATRVDSYAVTYTGLNQVDKVTESKSGAVVNTTSFTYNENSAPLTTSHDKQYSSYEYDARDLVSKVTNGKSATDASPKVTTYTYTDRGEKLREVKGNGNTVDYAYFLDGLLKSQTEKKPNGTLASDSTLDYDLNGNRSHDVTKKMNADNHGVYLTTTSDFTYDPRDRLASLTKTGDGAGTETYVHDANNNVTNQTVKGTSTTFNYERNRLLTAVTGGATASYNYDPFGRLDTVTKPDAADPTKEPYNAYRFNAKRWDQSSGNYDMGFRDYSLGLNRFLSRDSYNGALADMHLGSNPFTGNRYAFGGGNPISAVEIDGHCWDWAQDACDALEAGAEWVDHNSDALTDLAVDSAEILLGGAAVSEGLSLIGGGLAACGATLPALAGVVTAPITAAGCGAGAAAVVGGGVLALGGVAMAADGLSKWGDDFNRLERTGGSNGGGASKGDLGSSWKPQDPGDPKCFSGCEDVAKDIQKKLGGGQVYRLSNAENPPGGSGNEFGLGGYMQKENGRYYQQNWYTHDVVVYDGRVYDGFTDRAGVSMEEFESRWEYGGDILKWTAVS